MKEEPIAARRARTQTETAAVRLGFLLLMGLALAMAAGPAPAQDAESGVRLKLVGFGEGARDLGATGLEETQETYLEVSPEGHWQISENFGAHARVLGFASTGDVVLNEDNRPVSSDQFGAVRELWIEYGGITDYPGELLRLGLQRVRDADGLWLDRDIESVRWVFDTTLLQLNFGAGEQFNNYRTDDVELSPSQQDRAYGWFAFSREWLPGHRTGLRMVYAQDHGELPEPGTTIDTRSKMDERRFGWLGVRTENGFYEWRHRGLVTYWLEAMALVGTQESVQTDAVEPAPGEPPPPPDQPPPEEHAVTTIERDVAALGGDSGLRLRFPGALQLQVGATYAYAQGGRSRDTSNQFVQTGLQSNRSRYTGTRALLHRFNEAYQGDFTNIRAASVFMSIPLDRVDASLVFHQFARNDRDTPVSADGVDARPLASADSNDLGTGWDFVTSYYFARPMRAIRGAFNEDADTGSSIRLRGSTFQPGEAYGTALKDQYRVMLELGLWF